LDITSGNATVAFATATADIDGTNNAAVVGALAWTNALTGGAGTHAAAASWTISGIALDVGTNVITVRGTNTYAQSSSDSVSIVRQPEAGSGAIFEDDFEDGDLVGWTQDSVGNWTNSTSTPITGSRSLKHNLSSTATTNYIYAQPVYSLATSQTVWRFNLKNGSFDPSANNKFWVYLIANEGNLRSSTVDGYAVGVNLTGSDDLLKLWRVTDGAAASVVAASTLDWGSSFTVGIEVTRSTNGLWELKYDANGGFDALVSAGMGTDTTYTVTSYFGLLFQCTSSYAGLLRWDDISIYFTNNVSPDPDGDDDGDGMSNYEESIAGTDRDDEDSVFTATGARAAGGGNLIQWGSVAGRQYSISWTASLTNTFGSLVTGLPATPSLNSYTDTVHTAVTAIFYRIGVSLAP
ncbi:MAG: hypothetical protein KKC51_02105, partial [Verrucomicrobia bacterium]|nr:hypothetical protein [Verrucomicrobiota bacterium]